jgi:hypothetical protein
MLSQKNLEIRNAVTAVAELKGGQTPTPTPPHPLSHEIYYQMLVQVKIWYPKYVYFLLFRGVPPFLEHIPPLFEISGSALDFKGSTPPPSSQNVRKWNHILRRIELCMREMVCAKELFNVFKPYL